MKVSEVFNILLDKGYLSRDRDGMLLVTDKAYLALDSVRPKKPKRFKDREEFINFCEDFRCLWPAKVKAGDNTPARSGPLSIQNKLEKFFKKYKGYSNDLVMRAAEYYMDKLNGDYSYITACQYFIEKNGTSKLESICNLLKEHPNTEREEEQDSHRGDIV